MEKLDCKKKKTIVYLHGFGSTGMSSTGAYLAKKVPQYRVLTPDIPVDPTEALPFLRQYCEDNKADLVIGTSMGGMYAMQLYDFRRICVNPAFCMSKLINVGIFQYFIPTQTGETQFTITPEIIEHFRDMESHLFDGLTDENRRQCWGFFGNEDDVVNCRHEFLQQFYPNVIDFHGGHRLNNAVLRDVIIPFAKMLLDEEYTDEWGVTYSSYGRILKQVDFDRFFCDEYIVPEGVEVLDGDFWSFKEQSNLRKIHLPSTLRRMEANAFIQCPFEELVLPEGLINVGEFMCEACRQLKSVRLPSTIKKIEIGAFNCCEKLESINLPESITFIGESAFRYCKSLKHVTLPTQIDIIRAELFYGSGIESIIIPSNVEEIGYWAFWGCNNLRSLTIPSTVRSISFGIVSAHEGFEGIVCNAQGYHVENDALIDDTSHELLCCWTKQKHYVVPDCVRAIADMGGNPFVETIIVHQFVQITTNDTFASCPNLRKVEFLGGVEGFNDSLAFFNCIDVEVLKPEI